MRSLAPEKVGVGCVGNGAGDGGFDAAADAEEAFRSSLSGKEFAVARIDIAGQQVRAVGVGACHDQRGHAHHVGRQAGRNQLLDGFDGRHQYLAAQVSALLGGRELIFKVDAGGAGLDHGLHQFEGVQVAAETGFGIGDQRSEPVHCRSCLRRDESGRRASAPD